jgi:YD repeat-containing protein
VPRAWMRIRLLLLLVLLLLLPSIGVGQERTLERRERTVWLPADRVTIDRGPVDHLGWGTLEDLHVDLGAGAAVSVFSGNLVLHAPLFPRGDAIPDSQLALTYNHLDSDGAPEVGPGWTWDLGRFWTPGAWGDRVLVDGDGFRDSLFADDPPTADEVRGAVDELVHAWRKATPRRERRAVGGDDALRAMLAADPLFFAEMRVRFLGPPPEEVIGAERIFTSSRRGHRSMVDQDDGKVVVDRSDGGQETYSIEGHLETVKPAVGAPLELIRDGSHVTAVRVGGNDRWFLSHDSWGRITTIRSTGGTSVSLDYAGPRLWRMQTPAGSWKLSYDEAGHLTGVDSPEGLLDISYDPSTGRVQRASGPRGVLHLADPARDERDTVSVDLRVGEQPISCSWSARDRIRRVEVGGRTHEVEFEADRPLPTRVDTDEGSWGFTWNDDGLLLSARDGDLEARWERDVEGRVQALVGPGEGPADVVRGDSGQLMGWTDPAGRRTGLQLGPDRLPRKIERPGGLTEALWWTAGGLLRSVTASGGESLELRRDSRGYLRAVESVLSGTAGFRVGAGGQLDRFESPAGLALSLDRLRGEPLSRIEDGHAIAALGYRSDGLLETWQTPEGMTTVARSADALPVGAGDAWELDRDPLGRPTSLRRPGWSTQSIEWTDQGQPAGWSDGARSVDLRRDGEGRVTDLEGAVKLSLRLNRAGDAVEVQRGSHRWRLGRDASGRVTSVVDPTAATTTIQLDPAGRPTTISAPQQLRWRLRHDPFGRLTELRGDAVAWTLRYDRAGRPVEFAGPPDREAEVRWDRAGRWRSLTWAATADRPGGELEVSHGPGGPTTVGEVRLVTSPDGSFDSWGPTSEVGGWQVERDRAGRATAVGWRQAAGGARGADRPARRTELQRDAAGRITTAGDWSLRWTGAHIDELAFPDGSTWRQVRDTLGRVRRLEAGHGAVAEVERDAAGDARTLQLEQGGHTRTWTADRDSAARVTAIAGSADLRWELLRDPLGRVSRWDVNDAWSLRIEPLDGTASGGDGVLADALGVEVDEGPAPGGRPSGSRRVEVRLADTALLHLDEVREASGALAEVSSPWGTTGGAATPYPGAVLEQSPLDPRTVTPHPGALLDESSMTPEIGPPAGAGSLDPIAAALDARSQALAWAGALLVSVRGEAFVPAPDGRGSGASAASGWVRVPGDGGGTITWIGPGGTFQALRLPRPDGAWTTPSGWLDYPAPPGALDPVQTGLPQPPPHPGDAGGVEHWWSRLAVPPDERARLPRHTAAGPAWSSPRLALLARDALLPAEAPEAGPGALVPPVPGSSRLVPGPAGVTEVSPLTALILAGDLPPDADAHRRFLSVPAVAWSMEVPGAAILRDVAVRRFRPAVPPGWHAEPVAGLAPGLDGFLSSYGAAQQLDRNWHLRPATGGLPAGTADLTPGLCATQPAAAATLPVHGRCTAWDGLADDPLLPGARRQEATADDALLLFAASWQAGLPGPLSGWVDRIRVQEAWAVELPSGVRAVLDGHGRLLSADLLGRLGRAFGARGAVQAGRTVLHPGLDPAPALLGPAWLPETSDLPESRWGLAPADPRLPLAATGEPDLHLLRTLVGVPAVDPAWRWPEP